MEKSTVWTDTLKAHLSLAKAVASRLPAGEYLDYKSLNEVLELLQQTRDVFLFQCELQGFKTE